MTSRTKRRKKWNELLEFEQQSMELLEATLDMDEAAAEGAEKIYMEYITDYPALVVELKWNKKAGNINV